ncbi:MAG: acyltransferase [Chitinophagaceae bacterium]
MTLASQTRNYYPALDGLRGVAILLVVFQHNFKFMIFFFGWLGVDLFFVLSGFLITDILLSSLGKPNFIRNFYIRRVLRIFPLYYFILIICLFFLPNIKSLSLDMSYYTSNQVWQWTYLQNWLYVFKEPFGTPIILHTWSLAVEEQFYLLWPATILLIKKPKILLIIVSILLVVVSATRFILWTLHIKDLAYADLFIFTRIDGICVGCMLAIMLRFNPDLLRKYISMVVFGFAIINFGFYFLNRLYSYSLPYLAIVGYTTFAMLFGLLVYKAITNENKLIQFIFNNSILKFFGKISYGLYVYHWPVKLLFFPFFKNFFLNKIAISSQNSEVCSAILVTIAAVLLSVISYRYFESPFLKFKTRYA